MWRGRARVWVAGAVSGAVLVAVVQVGPRIPSLESLFGLPGAGGLNYSRLPGGLPPLSAEFLASVLGSPAGADRPDLGSPVGGGGVAGARAERPASRVTVSHPLTNDDFEQAYPVASVPFTAHTNAKAASRQPGEPEDCSSGSRTVWYRYTPSGDVGLLANTFGTRQPATLAVFTGDDLASLTLVDCDSDVIGNAYVSLPAKAGTTYHIQASESLGGPLSVNLNLLGATEVASVGSGGRPSDDSSGSASLSADGRYIAFQSWSNTLVEGDDNHCRRPPITSQFVSCVDVFVHDRVADTTTLVSKNSAGQVGNEASVFPSISADGSFVSFISWADNLVPGDKNNWPDVFVHDRLTRVTTRVSVSSDGSEGKPPFLLPTQSRGEQFDVLEVARIYFDRVSRNLNNTSEISADGRYIAFGSRLEGLVYDDSNGDYDVFIHDRRTGKTDRISVTPSGHDANKGSAFPAISSGGRFIVFESEATNLAPEAPPSCITNICGQIYLHDRWKRTTRMISVSPSGEPGNDRSISASVSADGRFVAFSSRATNLVPRGDVAQTEDIFVRDMVTNRTKRLTDSGAQSPGGQEVDTYLLIPAKDPIDSLTSITADGRFITFSTLARRSEEDDAATYDVFVHDQLTGATIRVSVSSSGDPGDDISYNPAISADGSIVAFSSEATNFSDQRRRTCPVLDSLAVRTCSDVFIHELPIAF